MKDIYLLGIALFMTFMGLYGNFTDRPYYVIVAAVVGLTTWAVWFVGEKRNEKHKKNWKDAGTNLSRRIA